MKISDVSYEWLEFRSPNLKEPTEARYRWLIEATIVPSIGTEQIETFDRIALQKFTNELPNAPKKRPKKRTKKGKGYHAETTEHGYGISTVKGSLQILKAVLEYAAEARYCTKFESYKVDWPKTYDSFNAGKAQALSDVQAKRLNVELEQIIVATAGYDIAPAKAIVENNNKRYALGVMLALRTGMRIGEVCGFNMSRDFDTFEKTAEVNETVVQYRNKQGVWILKITDPKTELSQREIPLDDDVCNLLATYGPTNGLLIPTGSSRHGVPNPRNLRNWFNRLIKTGKYKAITFHGLRHTFATRLLTQGVAEKIVSELLGHSDVSTTSRIYANPDKTQKREAMKRVRWK